MSGVGVIGGGYWGKNLIRNFYEQHSLRAVCDSNRLTLEKFQRLYPAIRCYDSVSELLRDPEVTAVAVATPAETHFELARRALQAGRDVFVEKPLALRVEEGEYLAELAETGGRILMVGHLLEHHFAVRKLHELIGEGELGDILYLYSNRLNLGKVRREENILWSFAPHDISVLLLLTGEMPLEVSACGGNYLQEEVADVTVTNLRFPGETRAHIFVSWLHPFKEHKLVVVGSKKMAVFNDMEPEQKLKIFDKGIEWIGGEPKPRHTAESVFFCPQEEPLSRECRHFLDCLANRTRPHTDSHDGIRVLSVLEACQRSMQEQGRPTPVQLAEKYQDVRFQAAPAAQEVALG